MKCKGLANENLDRWPAVFIGAAAFQRGQAWFSMSDGVRAEKDLPWPPNSP